MIVDPERSKASALLSGRTQIVGVIGWPIEHSVSPQMQNAAFAYLGLDWCYVPLPVHPESVPGALAGARALGLRGFNATVPHKQLLVPLVDELSPEGQAIGAVNTISLRDDGTCLGHNTDARGFLRALRESGFDPQGCSALVLGAGGAARAIVYALLSVGAQVTILNRTVAHAENLAQKLQYAECTVHACGPLTPSELKRYSHQVDLVVNTTSLGMWPHTAGCAWDMQVPFPRGALAYDLVYNPRETRFMQFARAYGAQTANGLSMLVHQGAEAFELWTGEPAPTEVMLNACRTALEGD